MYPPPPEPPAQKNPEASQKLLALLHLRTLVVPGYRDRCRVQGCHQMNPHLFASDPLPSSSPAVVPAENGGGSGNGDGDGWNWAAKGEPGAAQNDTMGCRVALVVSCLFRLVPIDSSASGMLSDLGPMSKGGASPHPISTNTSALDDLPLPHPDTSAHPTARAGIHISRGRVDLHVVSLAPLLLFSSSRDSTSTFCLSHWESHTDAHTSTTTSTQLPTRLHYPPTPSPTPAIYRRLGTERAELHRALRYGRVTPVLEMGRGRGRRMYAPRVSWPDCDGSDPERGERRTGSVFCGRFERGMGRVQRKFCDEGGEMTKGRRQGKDSFDENDTPAVRACVLVSVDHTSPHLALSSSHATYILATGFSHHRVGTVLTQTCAGRVLDARSVRDDGGRRGLQRRLRRVGAFRPVSSVEEDRSSGNGRMREMRGRRPLRAWYMLRRSLRVVRLPPKSEHWRIDARLASAGASDDLKDGPRALLGSPWTAYADASEVFRRLKEDILVWRGYTHWGKYGEGMTLLWSDESSLLLPAFFLRGYAPPLPRESYDATSTSMRPKTTFRCRASRDFPPNFCAFFLSLNHRALTPPSMRYEAAPTTFCLASPPDGMWCCLLGTRTRRPVSCEPSSLAIANSELWMFSDGWDVCMGRMVVRTVGLASNQRVVVMPVTYSPPFIFIFTALSRREHPTGWWRWVVHQIKQKMKIKKQQTVHTLRCRLPHSREAYVESHSPPKGVSSPVSSNVKESFLIPIPVATDTLPALNLCRRQVSVSGYGSGQDQEVQVEQEMKEANNARVPSFMFRCKGAFVFDLVIALTVARMSKALWNIVTIGNGPLQSTPYCAHLVLPYDPLFRRRL
ncbi:hypothetical protein R3P38DRAFT_3173305 [Favolaschia claudopus]|uniref:Uncharacterized protein n=1 Tax=Favolaschia claudopus TaxID=2862362 RepID=A0AAW0DFN3_9AGAR